MRPTDENQHGSTRPNLLSGGRRRAIDDDNILARLERDSARQALGNRSRAAWIAAAAALVLLLMLFAGWMAWVNASAPRVVPMTRAPADPGPVDAVAAIHDPSPVLTAPASIHDTAPPARDAAATGLPPLVLLQDAKPASPPQAAAAVVATPVPAVRPAATPAKAVARTARPASAPRTTPRPAPAPRPRKPAAEVAHADAPVDTDVAILSAIIIHDSTHAAERAQMEAAETCTRMSDRRCARKPQNK